MTPLETALVERIKAEGPLTVEAYMAACNEFYYATRDPLGEAGDFTTAPEISQMYGEVIGAALADCWVRAGKPGGVRYAELGPGRGTLASDALRVLRGVGCKVEAVELVETSPVLRTLQHAAVPDARFHDDVAGLAEGGGPLLLVASEFFDALPVRQFVDGMERHVEWIGGNLAFDRDGPIVEMSPAREAAMAELARVLAARGGVALVIDYGHDLRRAVGDTLQAMAAHKKTLPLATPGEQDLTAHVDFAALGDAARAEGAQVSRLIAQGSWLETVGIAARAMALAARNPDRAEAIAAARRRLCDGEAMGTLFRVMAVAAPGWPLPAGLE
ncbi:class I SAM-dependent methyltransferase [Sphingomonas mesophila]|uniref:class I SAM-dependent methyltransferase n=1 Tax=Sphingomonas mesophila TaxID=2303576 RepID=UPI001F078676|nr:SAM-dependent methyltransferase [Sphingomonas mesophila]